MRPREHELAKRLEGEAVHAAAARREHELRRGRVHRVARRHQLAPRTQPPARVLALGHAVDAEDGADRDARVGVVGAVQRVHHHVVVVLRVAILGAAAARRAAAVAAAAGHAGLVRREPHGAHARLPQLAQEDLGRGHVEPIDVARPLGRRVIHQV